MLGTVYDMLEFIGPVFFVMNSSFLVERVAQERVGQELDLYRQKTFRAPRLLDFSFTVNS